MAGRQPTGRQRTKRKCGCTLTDGVFCRHRKDGRIYYCLSYYVRGQHIQEGSGTNVKEAEALLRKRLREIDSGVQVHRAKHRRGTLDEYAKKYFAHSTKKTLSEMESIYRRVIAPRFGERALEDITSTEFEAWVKALTGSSSTIRNQVSVLRAMLRRAHYEGLITHNFVSGLPRGVLPPLRKKRQSAWRTEDVERLLQEDVPPSLRMINAIMAFTGCRQGEACGVRWCDLTEDEPLWALRIERQYDGGTLKGPDGDGAPRIVPVHPRLLELLSEWGKPGSKSEMVIVPNKDRPYTHNAHQKQFTRALKALGIDDPTRRTHAFRRHFVSSLRSSGVRAEVIRSMTHRGMGLDVLYRYDAIEWDHMCAAILKLPLSRKEGSGVSSVFSKMSHSQLVEIVQNLVEAPGVELRAKPPISDD